MTATLSVVFVLAMCAGAQATPVPNHGGKRVVDLAGVMTLSQTESLDAKLGDFEKRNNGTQIAVLVMAEIDDDPKAFANRVFNEWKLGRADLDNGVLVFFVTKKPRYCWIEVGYGAEQFIPDGRVGEIIRTKVGPKTKAGRYYEAFDAATGDIMSLLEGKFDVEARAPAAGQAPAKSSFWFYFLLLAAGGLIAFVLFAALAVTAGGDETPVGMRTRRRRHHYDDDDYTPMFYSTTLTARLRPPGTTTMTAGVHQARLRRQTHRLLRRPHRQTSAEAAGLLAEAAREVRMCEQK